MYMKGGSGLTPAMSDQHIFNLIARVGLHCFKLPPFTHGRLFFYEILTPQSGEFQQLKVREEETSELDTLRHESCPVPLVGEQDSSEWKANILIQSYLSRGGGLLSKPHCKHCRCSNDISPSQLLRSDLRSQLRRFQRWQVHGVPWPNWSAGLTFDYADFSALSSILLGCEASREPLQGSTKCALWGAVCKGLLERRIRRWSFRWLIISFGSLRLPWDK